jgi:hypothetical protein
VAGQDAANGSDASVLLVDVGTYSWHDADASAEELHPRCPVHGQPAEDWDAHIGEGSRDECCCTLPVSSLHLVQALASSLSSRLALLPWPLPACSGEVSETLGLLLVCILCLDSDCCNAQNSTQLQRSKLCALTFCWQDPLLKQTGPGFLDAPGELQRGKAGMGR